MALPRSLTSVLQPLAHFAGARSHSVPRERLQEVRQRARRFREELLEHQPVIYYRSFGLIRVPYPTRFALLNAYHYGVLDALKTPAPLVHILNRMIVVQYRSVAGVKTLLISPSDIQANRRTPFFRRLGESFGPLQSLGEAVIAPVLATVEDCLLQTGIPPEQVDYISYDHLHTQDLRKWLGSGDRPGFFPNARLLVMRQEWESAQGLLPPQADWYCPGGLAGIPPEKIIQLEGDTLLGEGMALLHTPGHTEGNHSFVARTPAGLMVTSENGVSADSYAPLHSRIPGVRSFAEDTGMEVILNGNTLEGGLDQYISMLQEKEIAGPTRHDAHFFNVVPSSELAAYWAFPGIEPTFSFGELNFGRPYVRDAD